MRHWPSPAGKGDRLRWMRRTLTSPHCGSWIDPLRRLRRHLSRSERLLSFAVKRYAFFVGAISDRPLVRQATASTDSRGRLSLQESVFKAGCRTVWHWPSPAGTVHASVNPPIPLPLVAGTTLAFPSGEGGPLAVDEENLPCTALSIGEENISFR